MADQRTQRYCADPEALNALKRDGLGWGHDLDCGCFHAPRENRTANPIKRVFAAFQKRK
ncbi:MAG: hypothetical protein AAFU41_09150 [Pseudomonadota bacterium]